MTSHPCQIRPFAPSDSEAIVRLHRNALGYSFNSKLGNGQIRLLYMHMYNDPANMVMVAVRDGTIAGFVSATAAAATLRRRLMASLTVTEKVSMAMRFLARPWAVAALVKEAGRGRPVVSDGVEVGARLVSIAVRPEERRTGIGRMLVGAVESFVRQHHCTLYYVDTPRRNRSAQSFYHGLGFVEQEQRGHTVILVKRMSHECTSCND